MKTILFAPFDCLVKTHNQDFLLQKNEKLSFDNFPNKLFVYPIGKTGIIPFEISNQGNSAFYKILYKEDNQYIFLLGGIYSENVEIYSFPSATVEVSTRKLTFSNKSAKKILFLPYGCQQFDCGNLYHLIYVKFATPNEKAVCFYNSKNNKAKIFYADAIEKEGEEFILTSSIGKRVLLVSKEGLKEKEKVFTSALNINPFQVPLSFMECLKEKDFSSALNLLAPSLKESQNAQSLKEFFGDISYIFSIDNKSIFAISNGQAKIYTFSTSQGLICDVQD